MQNTFLERNMQCFASKTLHNDPHTSKNGKIQFFKSFYASFVKLLNVSKVTMLNSPTMITPNNQLVF